jgi:hypothetical protein
MGRISLKGSFLTRAYGVFIISVKKAEQQFVFVGTTGDSRNYGVYSLIDKMALHLKHIQTGKDILFNRLMTALKITTEDDMRKWFSSAVITFNFYKTDNFQPSEYSLDRVSNHSLKIKKELMVKEHVISELSNKYKKNQILNLQKKRVNKQDKAVKKVSEVIIRSIEREMLKQDK